MVTKKKVHIFGSSYTTIEFGWFIREKGRETIFHTWPTNIKGIRKINQNNTYDGKLDSHKPPIKVLFSSLYTSSLPDFLQPFSLKLGSKVFNHDVKVCKRGHCTTELWSPSNFLSKQLVDLHIFLIFDHKIDHNVIRLRFYKLSTW